MRGGQRLIVELEAQLRESSGIPSLKLRYTRVFGWYIEVTKSHLVKAPAELASKADDSERRALHLRRARRARRQARSRRGAGSRRARQSSSSRLVRDLARHAQRLRAVADVLGRLGRRERARPKSRTATTGSGP